MKQYLACLLFAVIIALTLTSCKPLDAEWTTEKSTESTSESQKTRPTEKPNVDVEGLSESSAGLEFKLNDDGKSYTVTGLGTCKDTDIIIGKYNGFPVTAIGEKAFYNRRLLTSMTIGSTVESIGAYSFVKCTRLEAVYISDLAKWCTIEFAGDETSNPLYFAKNLYLNGTLVTDLVIPNGITSIPEIAFEGCESIVTVTIPDSVKSIGRAAFRNCDNLVTVILPESVTTIENFTFAGCTSLANINIPDSLTSIGGVTTFENCEAIKYNEYGNACYLGNSNNPYLWLIKAKDTSITSCEINPSCRYIFFVAFMNCKRLESLTVPDGVTDIKSYALSGCSSLTSVTFPKSTKVIQWSVFNNCTALTAITFQGTMEEWKMIEKEHSYVEKYTVKCTDGDIAKEDDN